jgi:type II secretory pathway component PulC
VLPAKIEALLHKPQKIISAIMIMFIGITLLNGILFFRAVFFGEAVSVAAPEKPVVRSQDAVLIAQIPAAHLFGEAPLKADNLTQTRLNLELNGVMLGGKESHSYAIISEPGKNQKLYHVGDALPGGAKLHQITSVGVVIQYNNKYEQLQIKRPK